MPCATCPDNDGDGHTARRCGGTDCDDADDSVFPKSPEFCGDTKDNDCDDKPDCLDETCLGDCADYDEDGFSVVKGDCDDGDPDIYPGAPETCGDTVDSNCDFQDPACPPCEIGGCPEGCIWNCETGYCAQVSTGGPCQSSPVLIDVAGDGFDLTDASGGVLFDLDRDGSPERLAWTRAGSDDAWLALDRDGDGLIEDGAELFGNFTPQPSTADPNGFVALAEFDKSARGRDGDGLIDDGDAVFASPRLWRDSNHDGVSQPAELHTLAALGLGSVELAYRESGRRDRHGNRFRYRAKVADARGAQLGRWAWDVFLQTAR